MVPNAWNVERYLAAVVGFWNRTLTVGGISKKPGVALGVCYALVSKG